MLPGATRRVFDGFEGHFDIMLGHFSTASETRFDHITFTGIHHGFYGTASPMITNLSFTTAVPEP